MKKVRKHIIFSGRVQGVGFRYKAYYLAGNFDLTGWVRNLEDGTVEMEVEGTLYAIEGMLDRLEHDSYIRIEAIHQRIIPLQNDRSFEMAN